MAHERLGIFLILLFAAISVIGILANMIAPGETGIGRLGILGGGGQTLCTGELAVTAIPQEGGKCSLQADVNMKNCEGKRWYVFSGNQCGGILVCNGNVNEPESKWRCSWEAYTGTHAFTLCADVDTKDSKTVSC